MDLLPVKGATANKDPDVLLFDKQRLVGEVIARLEPLALNLRLIHSMIPRTQPDWRLMPVLAAM